MCVSCHEPLAVAQSPQANSERAYIRRLIAQGETKAQIVNKLVAQYGAAVLGKPAGARIQPRPSTSSRSRSWSSEPRSSRFVLPRWRRRTRAAAGEPARGPRRTRPGGREAARRGARQTAADHREPAPRVATSSPARSRRAAAATARSSAAPPPTARSGTTRPPPAWRRRRGSRGRRR